VPEVIDVVLFPKGKVIPPGDMIITGPIDVSGAQHLTVNVVLGDPLTNVVCDIRFGRANEIFPQQRNTIGESRILLAVVPVHGPQLAVSLANNGSQPNRVDYATVYGIREATSSTTSSTPGSPTGSEG
jgi:hypothetical protein